MIIIGKEMHGCKASLIYLVLWYEKQLHETTALGMVNETVEWEIPSVISHLYQHNSELHLMSAPLESPP